MAAAVDEFYGFKEIDKDVRARRSQRRQARQRRQLIDRVRIADARLSAEQQRAKRLMNEAAGQDWRNLAG